MMALRCSSDYQGSGTKGYNLDREHGELLNILNGIMIKTQMIFEHMKGISSQFHDPVKKIDCVSKALQHQFFMMPKAGFSAYGLPEYSQEDSAAEVVPIARIRELVLNIKNLTRELGKPIVVLQKLISEMQTFSEKSFIKKYRGYRVNIVRGFAEKLRSINTKSLKPVSTLQDLVSRFQELTDNMQIYMIANVQKQRMNILFTVVKSLRKTSEMVVRLNQLVKTLPYKLNWFACKCQAFILMHQYYNDESSVTTEDEGEDKCDHADKWVWTKSRLAITAKFRPMAANPSLEKCTHCVYPM
ncbi:uncharacterized protein LOC125030576 [Penaeus chinensis]|uniref:uncharacterized protein LOC125030576 n=1 Tax=Penaeus chinensis TaxID=139456 RepID=UPI001FB70C48|nr:uncharacterized protein LOC125030576 [Penaeus chinensis]XP_047476657.1 uncharacterized protein LOC125030576 [Penaeus chinensis]